MNKGTNMRIGVDELKKMVNEAVKKRLREDSPAGSSGAVGVLAEGPSEIAVRMVMEDLREVIVGSITEDLVRQTSKEEKVVESVVSGAYEAMAREIIRNLDRAATTMSSDPQSVGGQPRRRTVVFDPMGAGRK